MKKYFGIFAVGLALTASAYTTKYTFAHSRLAGQWYLFNGNPSIPSEVNDPLKYSSESVPNCTDSGLKRCEVNAEPGSGGHPDLSQIYTVHNRP